MKAPRLKFLGRFLLPLDLWPRRIPEQYGNRSQRRFHCTSNGVLCQYFVPKNLLLFFPFSGLPAQDPQAGGGNARGVSFCLWKRGNPFRFCWTDPAYLFPSSQTLYNEQTRIASINLLLFRNGLLPFVTFEPFSCRFPAYLGMIFVIQPAFRVLVNRMYLLCHSLFPFRHRLISCHNTRSPGKSQGCIRGKIVYNEVGSIPVGTAYLERL